MACLFGVVGNVPVEAAVQSASTQQGKASGQEQADTYVMEDTVVTATRSKKKDVDVPAATVVITKQQIKESGATNAAEALGKVNGITYISAQIATIKKTQTLLLPYIISITSTHIHLAKIF